LQRIGATAAPKAAAGPDIVASPPGFKVFLARLTGSELSRFQMAEVALSKTLLD
jgi:hypothetical protein